MLLLLVVTSCFRSSAEDANFDSQGTPPSFAPCRTNADCYAASVTCCECPTFATSSSDPRASACDQVVCTPAECPDNADAVCAPESKLCVLQCKALACANDCPDGFALGANGCLSCECATPDPAGTACAVDDDCVRTRKDCCGCSRGGQDTAVLAGTASEFDATLMCPVAPQCPDPNTPNCSDDAPRCLRGQCELLPDKPVAACGSSDLAACVSGQVCTLNVNDQATLYGLGVCRSP